MTTDVASLAYDIDTTEVLKATNAVDELTESSLNADAAASRLGNTSVKAGKGIGTTAKQAANLNSAFQGNSLRNASFQISQIAQQSIVTGQVFQAIAIQIPDIFAGFGTVAILAGAAIGVIGSLALGYLEARNSANSFEDSLDSLNMAFETLEGTLETSKLTTEELVETYGVYADRVRRLAIDQAEIATAQAASRLREQVNILGDTVQAYTTAQDAGRNYLNTLTRIERELGITNQEARVFEDLLSNLGNSQTFEEQQEALVGILDLLDENNVALADIPPELQRALDEMITLSNETDRLRNLMSGVADESARVSIGGGRGSVVPGTIDAQLASLGGEFIESGSGSGSSRSGGRGTRDPYEDNLNRLVESLATERETLEIWYEESQLLLEDRRARELLTEEEHRENLLRLEEEYNSRSAGIQDSGFSQRLKATGGFFGAVAGLAASGNDKLIKIAGAAGAIEATINSYRAAAQALADPTVPFYAKAAAYAATLATGLGAVAAIKGTGSGGGGSSSSASAGSATTATTETAAPQRVLLDFQGDDFAASLVQAIIEPLQEQSDLGTIFEVKR